MTSNNRGICYGCQASVDENQEVCHICGQSLKVRDSLSSIQGLITPYYPDVSEIKIVDEIVIGENTPYETNLTMTNSPYQNGLDRAFFCNCKRVAGAKRRS